MHVRPIQPSDSENYRKILEDTSDEDRYCRFFHAVDHFDPEFIKRYVERRPDIIGFIALEDGKPLGAAHALAVGDGVAELAVVVARSARRRGVARALLEHVIETAGKAGFAVLIAYALRENRGFTAIARSLHMQPDPMSDGATVTWRLDLRSQTRSAESAPTSGF
jgi:GNAT superfamily N-acetyltransferase